MIVTYLGSSVKDYQEKFFHIIAEQKWPCPICGQYLDNHGYYERIVIHENSKDSLLIFRGKCVECKKTHAILPDFIAPYRHYAMSVISVTIEETTDELIPVELVSGPQDICTAQRWLNRFTAYCNEAAGYLNSIALQMTGNIPTLIGKIHSSPWQQLKAAILNLPSILSTSVMGAVNIWLTRDTIDLWL